MPPRSNSAPAAPALLRLAACALAVVIYTCLVTVKSTLYFPFCRTLVVCSANRSRAGGGAVGPSASPATPSASSLSYNSPSAASSGGRASRDWSGSAFCDDRVGVADAAQALKSYADVFNIVCQVLLMPVLGAVSDRRGRRPFLVLGAFGLFLQFVLCGLAARDVLPAPEAAPVLRNAIQRFENR